MKTKIISWLSCMAVLAFLLQSCRHDELTNPENSSPNGSSTAAKYASKSPWKEDEVYIGKVQQVFLKHANLPRVNETYGELHWEYAMSFGQFGERYALVPVVKNNKVTLIMEAVRKENKVYFYEKKDADLLQFFNYLLYSPTSDYTETTNGADTTGKAKYVCTTRTFIVGCGNGPTDCLPIISSQMVCEWKEDLGSGIPPQTFDPCGDPFGGGCGGGGGDGGFEYPEPPEEDPCAKIKAQNTNPNFTNKITELEGKTGLTKETGYIQRIDGSYTYKDSAVQSDTSNSLALPKPALPENKDIIAYIHTHIDDYTFVNADGIEETRYGIKIFSPADMRYFMDMLKNAQEAGNPLANVYAVMVTSSGNYEIRFTGNQYQIKNYTDAQINSLTADFITFMTRNYSKNLELGFLNFISEKMNIKGVNLYKMESNGTTKEIKMNIDKTSLTTTNCPT